MLVLQGPQLRPELRRPWSARLFYAYSDALAEAGRADEALSWLRHAAAADELGETDAADRLAESDGHEPEVVFEVREDEATQA